MSAVAGARGAARARIDALHRGYARLLRAMREEPEQASVVRLLQAHVAAVLGAHEPHEPTAIAAAAVAAPDGGDAGGIGAAAADKPPPAAGAGQRPPQYQHPSVEEEDEAAERRLVAERGPAWGLPMLCLTPGPSPERLTAPEVLHALERSGGVDADEGMVVVLREAGEADLVWAMQVGALPA